MKTYRQDTLQEIAFPLSGIGTGGISLSGIGNLIDWELTGRANKCSVNGYSHFAVKAERNGRVIDARVLQGDLMTQLSGMPFDSHHHSWGYGQGPNRTTLAGLPHFKDVEFTNEFPAARVNYSCESMPAAIELRAFNPFIPHDEDASSLPAAFFEWTLTNTADETTDYTIALSVGNPFRTSQGGYDTALQRDGVTSIRLSKRGGDESDPEYGELRISTDEKDVSCQEYWYRSGWFDDLTTFWKEFSAYGPFQNRTYDDDEGYGKLDTGDMATLAARVKLAAGERRTVRFLISWYFPTFVKYWDESEKKPMWKHEYCRRFADAGEVEGYCYREWSDLRDRSFLFRDALLGCSMPEVCLEAALSNLSILKSPTCLRLENGEFYAFEGTSADRGSCEGTCDHVWGYQYALAFLFPSFARQILEIDYRYDLKETGEMMFRTMLPLGSPKWDFRACVDGQMGSVMRFYREWKLGAGDEWLKEYWPAVKKTLEYAWSSENRDKWDPDKSGVITGRQHHTLDVELFGANSWLTGYYLGALKAAAEIAEYLGETDTAAQYRAVFENGRKYVDSELFNGKHYIQKVDLKDKGVVERFMASDPTVCDAYWNSEKNELKYQIGEGCEIDQMVAQWHAGMMGLGDLFDPEHVRTALASMYRINFRSMRDVFNPCRIFALNDEKGMLICNWDEGAYKPLIPIPYTEECMTGFEYAAALLMLQNGMQEEGLSVIGAIRDRYDGRKRNPFAEIECGSSYSRAMASFALPAVYAGYTYDLPHGRIGFEPITEKRPFAGFWATAAAWGTVRITRDELTLNVLQGALRLNGIDLPRGMRAVRAYADGKALAFAQDDRRVTFGAAQAVTGVLTLSV